MNEYGFQPRPDGAQPVRRRRRKRRSFLQRHGGALLLAAVVLILLLVDFCSYSLEIELPKKLTAEYGRECTDLQGEALLQGGLIFKTEKEAALTLKEPLDTAQLGPQKVRVEVTAKSWWLFIPRTFRKTLRATVEVVDTTGPVITLQTAQEPTTYPGGDYVEEGFTAVDAYDGDVSAQVTKRQEGDKVIYTATDSHGNTTTVTRQIIYREGVEANGRTIYLTFDDGPGKWTPELLATLKKYNVKATFFVCYTDFPEYIKLIHDDGHTVGVHSYSHRLLRIYTSESAFFEDMDKMQELIVQYTGKRSNILRFPGGSSNVFSDYNKGIMTRLAAQVGDHGYTYFDWNVDSMDSSTATTAEEVFEAVKKGIGSRKNAVVLQHDIKEFSVDAVEMIIQWGLENGFTFKALTSDSPKCHHKIAN